MSNDININESAILETLNAKIDYDGGNYPSSGLERTVNSTRVSKSGDTMTGDLTINKPTNSWPTIHFMSKGTMGETSDTLQYGARLISRDARNQYFATYEHSIAEDGRARVYMVARSTNDNGATYNGRRLEVACWPDGSGGTYIDGKLLKAFVTQTYVSGTSWYRVWSDGWKEQGGTYDNGSVVRDKNGINVTFLKAFKDANYVIIPFAYKNDNAPEYRTAVANVYYKTATQVTMGWYGTDGNQKVRYLNWYACGY